MARIRITAAVIAIDAAAPDQRRGAETRREAAVRVFEDSHWLPSGKPGRAEGKPGRQSGVQSPAKSLSSSRIAFRIGSHNSRANV